MQMSAQCLYCLFRKEAEKIATYPNEEKKAAYLQEIARLLGHCSEGDSAPYLSRRIDDIHIRTFGFGEDLSAEKHEYNARMLALAEDIQEKMERSGDPLRAALQYARAGNYIDFGAMDFVDERKLMEILDQAQAENLDEAEYRHFTEDLEKAHRFVLVHDNAGEIVMDMLLVRQLRRRYPDLAITGLVRGAPIHNDATMEDAEEVGLTREIPVIPNGSDIAGTELSRLSPEARALLEGADVILAKGQGNFETLLGEGLNTYYLFLNKCDWYMQFFGTERFHGMFLNDHRCHMTKYLRDYPRG